MKIIPGLEDRQGREERQQGREKTGEMGNKARQGRRLA